MSERLREHMMRGRISPVQAKAGAAWYGDWLEAGRQITHARMDREGRSNGSCSVMHAAARERLRKAEAALGGRAAPWYRVAHHIVLLEEEAKHAAELLEISPRSTMDILRLALSELAVVYRLYQLT